MSSAVEKQNPSRNKMQSKPAKTESVIVENTSL